MPVSNQKEKLEIGTKYMDIIATSGIKGIVIEEIRKLAEDHGVKKVILFGSRARGDYHEKSDIDLAVCGGDTNRFTLAVDEETSTLLMYDVVDLGLPVQQELKDKIFEEGVVIYKKI